MNDSDLFCARLVSKAVLLLSAAWDQESENADLTRLSKKTDAEIIEPSNGTAQEAFPNFARSFTQKAYEVGIIVSLLEAANLGGAFAHECLRLLKTLCQTFRSASSCTDMRELLCLRNDVKLQMNAIHRLTEGPLAERSATDESLPDEVTFTILFLTDLHWRQGGSEDRWHDVEKPFFDSLTFELAGRTQLDLVVFSGDLVFSGLPEQFRDGVDPFCVRLWSHFKKHRLGDPILLTVPGNHDLQRPSSYGEDAALKTLHSFFDNEGVRGSIFSVESGDLLALIQRAFGSYSEWQIRNTGYQVYENKLHEANYERGKLPGDFSYRLTKQGKTLGIVGLNSAFLQLTGDDFEQRLALDSSQFHRCCRPNGREWLSTNDANILMTHHPTKWLHPSWQKSFLEDICIPQFDVHLHGHLHTAEYQEVGDDAGMVRHIQGISLFGEERYFDYKNRITVKRRNGFMIVELKVTDRVNSLRFCPKEFTSNKRPVPPHEIVVQADGWTMPKYLPKGKSDSASS
jgi:hypothetical protein